MKLDRETFRNNARGPIQEADGTPRPMPKEAWELVAEQVQAAAGADAAANAL